MAVNLTILSVDSSLLHDNKWPSIDEKLIWGFTATVLAELFTSAGLISSFEADSEIEV